MLCVGISLKGIYLMEKYLTLSETADKWGISSRRVRTLCEQGRIKGAYKFGRNWAIPHDSEKPSDNRVKSGKYIKRVD